MEREQVNELRAELSQINESLSKVRGNLAALHERMGQSESRIGGLLKPLGTVSANSSLITICAVISAVALCKLAWWS